MKPQAHLHLLRGQGQGHERVSEGPDLTRLPARVGLPSLGGTAGPRHRRCLENTKAVWGTLKASGDTEDRCSEGLSQCLGVSFQQLKSDT